MKKFLAIVLALVMVVALAAPACAANDKAVKVWVAENVVDFTKAQIAAFQAANPEFADFEVTVEPVGEGDAASNVLTDLDAAADIFGFPQDQLARLVAANSLLELDSEVAAQVAAENSPDSVAAATMGDLMYAYPLTADNGYFLYYDKNVISDPSTIEGILADCEAAGKNFYYDLRSGWYQTAYFFGAGCTLTYETDTEGAYTACNIDYASDTGVAAMKALVELAKSPAFVNGSSMSSATNVAAIVDGTWDAAAVKEAFGDGYACAKLPTAEINGVATQLSGFTGFKLLGVKPQTDDDKLAFCDALAYFLASGEVQLARYKAVSWGPSNLEAQADPAVASDEALTALREQIPFMIPQGNYPGEYWGLAEGLGDDIIAGKFADADDAAMLAALQTFQSACEAVVK